MSTNRKTIAENQEFENFTFLHETGTDHNGQRFGMFICKHCGENHEVRMYYVLHNTIKSCGCLPQKNYVSEEEKQKILSFVKTHTVRQIAEMTNRAISTINKIVHPKTVKETKEIFNWKDYNNCIVVGR